MEELNSKLISSQSSLVARVLTHPCGTGELLGVFGIMVSPVPAALRRGALVWAGKLPGKKLRMKMIDSAAFRMRPPVHQHLDVANFHDHIEAECSQNTLNLRNQKALRSDTWGDTAHRVR